MRLVVAKLKGPEFDAFRHDATAFVQSKHHDEVAARELVGRLRAITGEEPASVIGRSSK